MPKPEIKYYSLFEKFPELVHGFSTRIGGVSQAPFTSLNLGASTPDDAERVRENRRLFFKALNIPQERIVFPRQVHSANIRIVNHPGIIAACDALITAQNDLFLSIQTADCFPVFLFDPNQRVVAIVHSGWRGTAKNIVGKTIRQMIAHFAVQPAHILAVIGPGVQKSCYQVDETVVLHFDAEFYRQDGPAHYLLDLQGAIHRQMTDAGIRGEHIEVDLECTHCRSDLYYSYRRDGKQSGRMMGIIGLRG